jgi:hypothetical protein
LAFLVWRPTGGDHFGDNATAPVRCVGVVLSEVFLLVAISHLIGIGEHSTADRKRRRRKSA